MCSGVARWLRNIQAGSLADVQNVMYNICVLFQLCTKARCSFHRRGPCAVNMLEHGDENQTTTNKCFLLPTAAILEQITKRTFFGTLDSGRPKTCALVFHTFYSIFCFFFHCVWLFRSISGWWGRFFFFVVVVVLHVWFPGVSWSAVLAGWQRALSGLNKQLWHMGRTYSSAPRLSRTASGDEGTCGNVKKKKKENLTCLCLMAWSVTFLQMLAAAAAAAAAAPLGIH